MSATTGLDSMSVAPRLSRAVQKLERWALYQQSESDEPSAWDKINPRTDLKVLPYKKLNAILDDREKCKALLDKLVVVKLCGTLGRALGTTQPKSYHRSPRADTVKEHCVEILECASSSSAATELSRASHLLPESLRRSLVEVRDEQSFLDMAVQNIEVQNSKYNAKALLVLATSDNTEKTLNQTVKKYSNADVDIIVFNQTEYPREVWPVIPKLGEDGGYLTNNGDLFAALAYSGKLDELLAQGKEFMFTANCDNLGATLDLSIQHLDNSISSLARPRKVNFDQLSDILSHLSENQSEYCMEVTPKGAGDVEGCASLSSEGNIELLELEEVARTRVNKSRSGDIKVLNINSTWVNLKAVKRLAEIEALDIYCSSKVGAENEETSYQLQTAGGAPLYSVSGDMFENLPIEGNSDLLLVQFFDGCVAVDVPRSRFIPVRATSDLLLLQSDLYTMKEGLLCQSPSRESKNDPVIKLEGLKLKKIEGFRERMGNTPSLQEIESLEVVGDVWFGKNVVLQGKVVIWAKTEEKIEIPEGDIIKDKLVTAGPVYTDLAVVEDDLDNAPWAQDKESDPDMFEEEDFPPCPPDWSDLDMETYKKRKKEVVGKPIWVQDVDDENLKELGYSSWKPYVVDSCISNW